MSKDWNAFNLDLIKATGWTEIKKNLQQSRNLSNRGNSYGPYGEQQRWLHRLTPVYLCIEEEAAISIAVALGD